MIYTLVSGATGVLGGCFCRALAARGENLFITGRSADKLICLQRQLTAEYPAINVLFHPCDLSDDGQVEALFKAAENLVFGAVYNVAGADVQKPFEEYTADKIRFQIRGTFEGAALLTFFALSHRAEKLQIVNVSSVCAQRAMPYFALYAASKAALDRLSYALSYELSEMNCSVTCVLPGSIKTRADVREYIQSLGRFARKSAKSPEWVVEKTLKAAARGKRRVILGAHNKFLNFALKFAPRGIQMKFISRRWRKTRKDAF